MLMSLPQGSRVYGCDADLAGLAPLRTLVVDYKKLKNQRETRDPCRIDLATFVASNFWSYPWMGSCVSHYLSLTNTPH